MPSITDDLNPIPTHPSVWATRAALMVQKERFLIQRHLICFIGVDVLFIPGNAVDHRVLKSPFSVCLHLHITKKRENGTSQKQKEERKEPYQKKTLEAPFI